MNVMTYNIRCLKDEPDKYNNWKYRREALAEIIRKHNPDILCLQEDSPEQIKFIQEKISLHHHSNYHAPQGKLGEALSIFSKAKFVESGYFWLTDTPKKKSRLRGQSIHYRHVTYIAVGGIHIFNTHFDHLDQKIIGRQGEILLREIISINPQRYILCGDFNCEIKGYALKLLQKELNLLSKNLANSGRKCWSGMFPASKCIDFIFSNIPGKAIMDMSTYKGADGKKRTPSDHFPVIGRLHAKIY